MPIAIEADTNIAIAQRIAQDLRQVCLKELISSEFPAVPNEQLETLSVSSAVETSAGVGGIDTQVYVVCNLRWRGEF